MRQYPLKPNDVQHITGQADLNTRTPQRIAAQIFRNLVMAGDGDQLGGHLLTENPGLRITFHASQHATTHRAVYMDVAIGEKFRPGLTEEITTRSLPWA